MVEVVSEATVKAALKAKGKPTSTASDPYKAAQRKAKRERVFRRELYTRLRPLLPAPTPQAIATVMLDRLQHETLKTLCDVRGFEPPKKKYYGHVSHDYKAIGKGVETWTDQVATELINDMIYVTEFAVGTYSTGEPERLLAAAKVAGIDVAKLKRELAPKPKSPPAKRAGKKASKKAGKKRAAKA